MVLGIGHHCQACWPALLQALVSAWPFDAHFPHPLELQYGFTMTPSSNVNFCPVRTNSPWDLGEEVWLGDVQPCGSDHICLGGHRPGLGTASSVLPEVGVWGIEGALVLKQSDLQCVGRARLLFPCPEDVPCPAGLAGASGNERAVVFWKPRFLEEPFIFAAGKCLRSEFIETGSSRSRYRPRVTKAEKQSI